MIDRRAFLRGFLAALAWPLAGPARSSRADEAPPSPAPSPSGSLPSAVVRDLESSPYVYVSPLRAGGQESTCHGEVWYGWIDGGVVLITGTDGWKARSIRRGLDRARLWVGDFGRWKKLMGRNERFREGPSFDARASLVQDAALLDRLLAIYAEKYPDEIGRWSDRFRRGYADGSRVLIRYEPLPSRPGTPGPP